MSASAPEDAIARTLVIAVALVIPGCFSPEAPLGAPCSEEMTCPEGQMCVDGPDGPRCAGVSIGTDLGPPNDHPDGAIDVERGGIFRFDLRNADDDATADCADLGPDVYYRLRLNAPEVVYFDTFGSDFDTAIIVHAGTCEELGAELACNDDSCGSGQSQGAWQLEPGEHCIVIEGSAEQGSDGHLEVVRSGNVGDPLPARGGTVTGNTCNDDNSNDAGCGSEPAKDHHYYFTMCEDDAGPVTLATCGGATFDTVLQLRAGDDDGIACNDDACGVMPDEDQSMLTRRISGPVLFWAIIDGFDDECGPYTLTYDLGSTNAN